MPQHILLGVTGSIAAYKSCELIRLLKKQGHIVTVALSRAASEFINAQTFQALSGNPVLTHNAGVGNGMTHINASRAANIMLIAPATANTLAKIAHGIADNLITEMAAARNCPLVVAPAMNVQMWHNPANLRNIAQLQADGIHILMPNAGEQACGETGIGRMLEAAQIADLLPDFWSPSLLHGKRVLLTIGATYEAIDPVRGITNISTGQMGVALARACRRAGAHVSVVYGKISTTLPENLAYTEQAISAQAMHDAVFRQLKLGQDIFIAVSAVADYRVANASAHKIKKVSGSVPILELTENPDILRDVAALPHAPFCVGFAAESNDVLVHAQEKRLKKNVPMLIANAVSDAMGKSTNKVIILDEIGITQLPQMSKDEAAQIIVERIAQNLPCTFQAA